VFDGSHANHPAVTLLRAVKVIVDADPPQPLLIDGEVCGTTPATITIERQVLPIKAPPV
jgi:diacylglycerol kinase (ATP)